MKQKITEQSIRLFEKNGFAETSIQDIVESLGVTKGTFYYYFSSKEELLMNIHLEYIQHLLEKQAEIMGNDSLTAPKKIHAMVTLLIRDIRTQGLSAKIFFREMKALSSERLQEIIPKRDQFRLNIERVIKEGMQHGELRDDLNPSIVTFGILGISNWSYQWFNPEGTLSDLEVADIFVEMILKGIERGE